MFTTPPCLTSTNIDLNLSIDVLFSSFHWAIIHQHCVNIFLKFPENPESQHLYYISTPYNKHYKYLCHCDCMLSQEVPMCRMIFVDYHFLFNNLNISKNYCQKFHIVVLLPSIWYMVNFLRHVVCSSSIVLAQIFSS